MLGGSNNTEVIAWINEAYDSCEIQVQLPKTAFPEQTMLSQILAIVRSSTSLELIH
jgi:hypothetical protein